MKTEIGIITLSIFMVLVLAFGLFNVGVFNEGMSKITGFAVGGVNLTDETIIPLIIKNVTKEIVINEIKNAENIINQTKERGLPTTLMGDNLIDAKRTFEQVEYAEVLRNSADFSKNEVKAAQNNLKLINWKNIYYKDVLVYTDRIKEIKTQETLLKDTILIREDEVNSLSGELYSTGLFSSEKVDTSESKKILEEIKKAYEEERFGDADKLLIELRDAIEKERQQAGTMASLKSGTMNFFQRYWIFIVLILGAFGLIGMKSYKSIDLNILKNKIIKMKTEKQVLLELMKKAQTERFQENKISGLVYNIRMKKYEERMNKIKEQLPVLESRLRKEPKGMEKK
jgi:hypothetical protein